MLVLLILYLETPGHPLFHLVYLLLVQGLVFHLLGVVPDRETLVFRLVVEGDGLVHFDLGLLSLELGLPVELATDGLELLYE